MTKVLRAFAATIISALVLSMAGCERSHFLLPGKLVLSEHGWDHVAYFDGLHYREVKIRPTATTTFVNAAHVGPDGVTYAISHAGNLGEDSSGNTVVAVADDGTTRAIFEPTETSVLSFAPISSGLVVLAKTQTECSVKWISYQGRLLKSLPAPCDAFDLDASTATNTILRTEEGVLLQRGDKFEPTDFGIAAIWINSDELMYWEDGKTQCTWRYSLSRNSRRKVTCGYWFSLAASPDGRYIAVRVLTTIHWFQDIPELRVLDTQTGRYVPVIYGAPPIAHWVPAKG